MGKVLQKVFAHKDIRQGLHSVYRDVAKADQLFVMTMMTLVTGVNPMDVDSRTQ